MTEQQARVRALIRLTNTLWFTGGLLDDVGPPFKDVAIQYRDMANTTLALAAELAREGRRG